MEEKKYVTLEEMYDILMRDEYKKFREEYYCGWCAFVGQPIEYYQDFWLSILHCSTEYCRSNY